MALRCGLAVALAVVVWGAGVAVGEDPVRQASTQHTMETVIQDDALLLHRPASEVRRTARRMADLGVDRVRLTASWGSLAPGSRRRRKPSFDASDSRAYPRAPFAALDRAVKEVRRADMKVMIDLAFFAPRWAVRRGGPGARHADRPSPREFGLFTRAVAERYGGRFHDPTDRHARLPRVSLWTTWNEPNHPVFLRPQWERVPARPTGRGRRGARQPRRTASARTAWRPTSPHIYRRLHNAAYDQVKAVAGDNEVLIGGLASEAEPGRGSMRGIGPLRFTRELACVDSRLRALRRAECRRFRPLRADGFALHPYSLRTTPEARDDTKDRVQIGELDRMTGLLDALHERGRIARPLPLFITEYGYETNPPDPRGHAPEDHARYLGHASYLAWRQPEVRMFAQFLLEDIGPDTSKPAGSAGRWADYQTGLFHHDGRPKQSVVQAFRVPFWVETVEEPGGGTHTVAFGQVRPRSGLQNVVLQRRDHLGRWIVEASLRLISGGALGPARTGFATHADGTFLRQLPYRPSATYRAVWLRGDRVTRVSQEITVGAPRRVLEGITGLARARSSR